METEGTRGGSDSMPQARPSSETDQQPLTYESSGTSNAEREEESSRNSTRHEDSEKTAPLTQGMEILKAIQVAERDSVAIAQSFTSLFASLRLALSQVTTTSVDHMSCFSDASGRLQECALDAATKGNRYINSCLRLNEEMKGIDNLASQLKSLKRNVDALDSAVNRMVRFP